MAAVSAKFGNRLVAQPGYGETARLIVLMAVFSLGLPLVTPTS